jgi:hypothetical protein
VSIYIDESEINGNILIGAIVVPDKYKYSLSRKLNLIRRRMLKVMRQQDYPILISSRSPDDRTSRQRTERVRLAGGGLPEIHAAELWTGDEVFWKERDGTGILFNRHLKWLKEALGLIEEFEVTYHLNSLNVDSQNRIKNLPEAEMHAALGPFLTKDISIKKLSSLQKDPFVRLLFGFMQSLERYYAKNQKTYTVICDKGKKNEMFKGFETFSTLKKYGSWQMMTSIGFEDSHDNPLIQLSDVVTYIEAKALWLDDNHKDKNLFEQLKRKYLNKASRPTLVPFNEPMDENGFLLRPSILYAELMMMFTEMALLHCGGTNSSLPERKERLERITSRYPDVFMSERRR